MSKNIIPFPEQFSCLLDRVTGKRIRIIECRYCGGIEFAISLDRKITSCVECYSAHEFDIPPDAS